MYTFVLQEIKNKDLYIRGSGLGLNWTSGKKMTKISTDTWEMHFNFTSSDDGFRCQDCSNDITINKKLEYRILIADKTNMIGGNFVVHLPVAMPSSYFHEKPLFKVYPWFYSTAGHTSNFTIHSQEIGKERKIYLYFPPSFNENTYKKYPNLLVFDLYPGGDSKLLAPIVDKLLAKTGTTKEFIIIGYGDYQPVYERFSLLTPVPGVIGYSLGGLMSCYAAWTRSSIFGLAACQSPSLWLPLNNATLNSSDFDFINNTLRDQSFQQSRFPQKIILDAGSEETVSPYRLTQSTVEAAKMISNISGFTMNRNVWVNIYPGASHTVLEWFSRFWTVTQFVKQHTTEIKQLMDARKAIAINVANVITKDFHKNHTFIEYLHSHGWLDEEIVYQITKQTFFEKSISLSWLIAVQDPEIYLDGDVEHRTKFDKDHYREYTKVDHCFFVVFGLPCIFTKMGH
ncbi:unnamed protein product [Mytilus coruscus]|uniref:Uncharacterized protein n=1 Tax=Mytilus coruscus TaxID=42192 RepID=A0A6J8CZ31_MYTCO|nr:unnamed protein product [Mytilus coruscus]